MATPNLKNINIFYKVDFLLHEIFEEKKSVIEIQYNLNDLYGKFWEIYDESYDYALTINAFIGATQAVMGDKIAQEVFWEEAQVLEFLRYLDTYKESCQKERLLYTAQEARNRKNIEDYISNLTAHYSKLLFVRIDLHYLKNSQDCVTVSEFYEHISNFRDLISNKNTCFENLQGYIWAIEHGMDRSFHCHLLLIYDGSKHQNDYGLAKMVGEKWVKITHYKGGYYNVNTPSRKNLFKKTGKLGIGMIFRNDNHSVQNAINAAKYLTEIKADYQHAVIKIVKMRTFGKGQFKVGWRRGIK